MSTTDLHHRARALDTSDPLRAFRDAFALPPHVDGRPSIYLCGHSLGLAPLAARARLNEVLDDWGQLAVLGHHVSRRAWIDYAELLRPGLAQLAGAHRSEVVAMNSLTVNLHL
ncbi:MAG: kynureninase, partial [Steroidobacteraceae bacterium]